jgi:fatty-acyl-CoA synthase
MSDASTPAPYDYPLLIRHLLHTPLAHAPDREIVYADRVRYDYRTLRARIGRLASALTALGIRPGDTVGVMDWDSHRYLECFFAVPMMGAVLHTVNIRLSPEQILYTINHAADDVLLVHTDFLPLLGQIRDRIDRELHVVLLTDGSDVNDTSGMAAEYEQMLTEGDPDHAFEDFDENTRATTFYTTGTTGDPKGVYYSHRQLVLHTLAVMAAMGGAGGHGRFHRDDVYMPLTPMFHVHAWGTPYGATVMGVKQVYPGRYVPEKVLELIAREQVTYSHCVPTILYLLLSSPAAERMDLSRWKVCIGGAALPRGLARQALARGIDVFSGYGLSETCPVLTLAQLEAGMLEGTMDEQLEIRCKTGRPLPLVDLRVVDENMNERPHDGRSTGEVVVRAPWLTHGYLKEPERSRELWRGGYLHTGDIGHIDPRGYLQLTDRLKDVIKSGGEWISSLQLEDVVSRCEGVSEVAAIGVPDEKWGERPLVLVVPTREGAAEITEDRIRAHIKARAEEGLISAWAVPEHVHIVQAIEKTSVGKIDKKQLRERYG